MSELSAVSRRVFELLHALNIEVPSDDTDLFETGLVDSLTFVEILAHVEEEMGVTVTLEQLEPDNFRSVKQIALFVLANRPFSKYATEG